MMENVINLDDAFATFDEPWSPRIVAAVNDYAVKIAHVTGDFVWHDHPHTDEFFLVIAGKLTISLGDPDEPADVTLERGDIYVVPRGVQHRPVAEHGTRILLFEPKDTINTGQADGSGTAGSALP